MQDNIIRDLAELRFGPISQREFEHRLGRWDTDYSSTRTVCYRGIENPFVGIGEDLVTQFMPNLTITRIGIETDQSYENCNPQSDREKFARFRKEIGNHGPDFLRISLPRKRIGRERISFRPTLFFQLHHGFYVGFYFIDAHENNRGYMRAVADRKLFV